MSHHPRLNCQLFLDEPIRTADGAGGHIVTWSQLGLCWAEVRPRRGRELSDQGVPTSRVLMDIILRSAPVGQQSRPVAGQRFRHGTRLFYITAVTDYDPEGRYLTCATEEEVAT